MSTASVIASVRAFVIMSRLASKGVFCSLMIFSKLFSKAGFLVVVRVFRHGELLMLVLMVSLKSF